MIPYENCIFYGPHIRKDNRAVINVVFPNGRKTLVSYPKYLKEVELGRYLDANETVDHIDQDFTNDELSNLTVLKRSDHGKLDALRLIPQNFKCPVCSKLFTLKDKKLSNILRERRRKNTTGPYCSRSCAGRGSTVQNYIHGDLTTLKSLNKE